ADDRHAHRQMVYRGEGPSLQCFETRTKGVIRLAANKHARWERIFLGYQKHDAPPNYRSARCKLPKPKNSGEVLVDEQQSVVDFPTTTRPGQGGNLWNLWILRGSPVP